MQEVKSCESHVSETTRDTQARFRLRQAILVSRNRGDYSCDEGACGVKKAETGLCRQKSSVKRAEGAWPQQIA